MAKKNWFKLDNAAKIYPAVNNKNNPAVFRVAVVLKEEIDGNILKKALENVMPRFPTMGVRMKKGLFWFYFDENKEAPRVSEDKKEPCSFIDPLRNNGYLFRVSYFKGRIALEFFHSLTDGYGAFELLKSLAFEYLALSGHEVEAENLIKTKNSSPSSFELEDSFLKHFKEGESLGWKENFAEHIEGTESEITNLIIHGILDVISLKKICKENEATITEFLSSAYIYAIHEANMKFGY